MEDLVNQRALLLFPKNPAVAAHLLEISFIEQGGLMLDGHERKWVLKLVLLRCPLQKLNYYFKILIISHGTYIPWMSSKV